MTAKQTAMLMGRLVEHQLHFHPLPTADAQWAIRNPKNAAALCVTAIKGRTNGAPCAERTYRILRPVAPKTAEVRPFKADETFFNKKSVVKMVWHGSNFTNWFKGFVEEDAPEGMLVPLTLTQAANDSEIIADLGGEEKAEVTLTEVWRLMERQWNGEDGMLLTNGYANIFYVRDVNGLLRAVSVGWGCGGWYAHANALDVSRWVDDRRVFSRNS